MITPEKAAIGISGIQAGQITAATHPRRIATFPLRVKRVVVLTDLNARVGCCRGSQRILLRPAKPQERIRDDLDLVVIKSFLRKTPDPFGGIDRVECLIHSIGDESRRLQRVSKPFGAANFAATAGRFVRRLGRRWRAWHNANAEQNGFLSCCELETQT